MNGSLFLKLVRISFWGSSIYNIGAKWLCWAALVGYLIYFAVLNPYNPDYVPTERAALEREAKNFEQSAIFAGTRWDELMRGPAIQCHYQEKVVPHKFIISGPLSARYIVSNSGEIWFYVIFAENGLTDMWGNSTVQTGIISPAAFYTLIHLKNHEFSPCDSKRAAQARQILFAP